MGVQGFTPFLQKTVPHIIHKLPNRLKDLSGKKLVLDGTLITQRLHFAPSPHPYRHVLGWYNLARELNDNNIRAVCIFDGNLRAKAKALELGKREASRKLHVSRGTLESVRIKRLQKLKAVMANVRALDEKGKSVIAEMLSRLNVNDVTGTVGAVEGLNRVGEALRALSDTATPPVEEERTVEQEREGEEVVRPTTSLMDEGHVEGEKAVITPEMEPSVVEPSLVQDSLQAMLPVPEQRQIPTFVQEESQVSLPVQEQPQDLSSAQEQPPDSTLVQEQLQEPSLVQEQPQVSFPVEELPQDPDIVQEQLQESTLVPEQSQDTSVVQEQLQASLPIEEQPSESVLVQEQPPVSSLVQEQPQDSPDVLEKPQDAFPIDEQPQDSMLAQEQQQNSLLVEEQLQDPSPVQEQPQDSRVIGFGAPELGIPANVPSAEDIKSMILSSYRDFQLTISKVASLSSSERKPKILASGTLSLTEEMDNQEEELVLSKTQCELTLEEEKVWDELTLATSPVVESAPIPALPISTPTSLEVPPTSPPPDAAIPTSIASSLETLVPPSLEPPPAVNSQPAIPIPSGKPSPPPKTETLSPLPETQVPSTAASPNAGPTSSEPPSLPPEILPAAALPIPTPQPEFDELELELALAPASASASAQAQAQAQAQAPEPIGFTLDHSALSAAEDRLHVLASRSESIADSYQRRTYVPTKTTYMESREILEAMGIPCYEIQGEHEGEGVASSLVLQGMADYVVSEDTDVLVYGAPIVRNFTSHGNPLTVIHGNDVREALDLSNDACIDFAILLGTDFSQRIKNVGPTRALKLIKEYETIENILNSQTKHQPKIPHEEYMAQVESARAIFSSPPPIPSQLRLAVMSTGTELLIDQAKVAVVMERCGLGRALVGDSLWDYEAALDGNYFSDNPSMIVS
ncbi:hypothetical protein Agabi119p4_8506 [Agaricus bisporus var. burnettii]|uniref:XPG-I domain-containing protein n=1 Tax=Agaricus bisporus var. burnettii TaxID=192524 RepID=A0A8H7C7A6_AGABI|nr:hypothetical protein Agabi119p4_8506 [Agaricus bisporus var. burnettii]